jgi:integrase
MTTNKTAGRRRFGSVRRLPSGRFQARYRDETGTEHTAPETFATKTAASRWLVTVETDMLRGQWIEPRSGEVPLKSYAEEWLVSRPNLRPRTREFYASLLRLHILPGLGAAELGRITPSAVRRWHADLCNSGVGSPTVAKSYRLLRTILGTAAADELIFRNPCTVKGAGVEHSPERPVATVAQVYELAAAIEPRYSALVLTAAMTGCRWGELVGLTRRHLDLLHGTMTVAEALVEAAAGLSIGPPKSEAGRRTVALPPPLVPVLEEHLARFAQPGVDGLVFCGAKGARLRRSNFSVKWSRARRAVGMEQLHFHDLRHTANTLAAATGASTRELMHRMGHSSSAAALRYQHATRERDQAIAKALGDLVARQIPAATPIRSGTPMARKASGGEGGLGE